MIADYVYRGAALAALVATVLGSNRRAPVGSGLTGGEPAPSYPFAVGESLKYAANLGYFTIGSARLSVPRVVRVRNADTFVLNLVAEGGPPGYSIRYELTSWVGTKEFTSRRFDRAITQNGTTEKHRFEILPDSGRYREIGVTGEWTSPRDPLDELALLYYLRFAPLQVGQRLAISRYFQTNVNPIAVTVTGREPVVLPSGEKPVCLATDVVFQGHTAQVWFTDDARRIPAQFALPLPYGSVTLQLAALP